MSLIGKDTFTIEHAGTDSHGLARKVYYDGIYKPGLLYMLSEGPRYSRPDVHHVVRPGRVHVHVAEYIHTVKEPESRTNKG